jgi:hypothetical protein
LVQVGEQCLARPRVLHLDGDLPAVVPHRAVHLSDGGRCGRFVLEFHEQVVPVLAQPFLEHGVHRAGRHRWRGLLELCECSAIRPCDLLGQRRLEDGQRLPELHRAALELAEHLEQLLRRALLQLAAHDLRRLPADPFADAPCGPSGEAER